MFQVICKKKINAINTSSLSEEDLCKCKEGQSLIFLTFEHEERDPESLLHIFQSQESLHRRETLFLSFKEESSSPSKGEAGDSGARLSVAGEGPSAAVGQAGSTQQAPRLYLPQVHPIPQPTPPSIEVALSSPPSENYQAWWENLSEAQLPREGEGPF